jgi:hypothetical protein
MGLLSLLLLALAQAWLLLALSKRALLPEDTTSLLCLLRRILGKQPCALLLRLIGSLTKGCRVRGSEERFLCLTTRAKSAKSAGLLCIVLQRLSKGTSSRLSL